jgi:hypothetical protein
MAKQPTLIDGPNASEDSGADPQLEDEARRAFLTKAGKFAAVTPPAITLLLGTSLGSEALAASSGSRPGRRPGMFPGRGHEKPRRPRRPRRPFNPGRGPNGRRGAP